MISTRDLSQLPDIDHLKALTQSLAVLDAILSSAWEYRYYSFNAHWAADRSVASMRDGSGDEMFAIFAPAGAIVKGFAHESPMSPHSKNPPTVWPGVLDAVPSVLAGLLADPAFSTLDATFCIRRTRDSAAWQRGTIEFPEGKDPDGSEDLLAILDGNPRTYQAWAECYFERSVSLPAVVHIYEHRPLSEEIIAALNPNVSMRELAQDLEEIAYP
jgi:hypothetical protein